MKKDVQDKKDQTSQKTNSSFPKLDESTKTIFEGKFPEVEVSAEKRGSRQHHAEKDMPSENESITKH